MIAAGPAVCAIMAVIAGGVAGLFSPAVGWGTFGTGVVSAVILEAGVSRARRVGHYTILYAFSGFLALAIGILAIGIAILAPRTEPATFAAAAALLLALSALAMRRAVARREREWAENASFNTEEILSVRDGTYRRLPGCRYESAASTGERSWLDRAMIFGAPAAIALSAGAGGRGWGGARELVLLVLGPLFWFACLPYLATGLVGWQKLRQYERQLGRDVVNR